MIKIEKHQKFVNDVGEETTYIIFQEGVISRLNRMALYEKDLLSLYHEIGKIINKDI